MSDAPPGPSPSRPERRSSRTVEQDREPWPDQEQAFLARLLERLPYPVSYVDAGLVYRCCNAAGSGHSRADPGTDHRQDRGLDWGADSEVVTLLRRVLESGGPCSGTLELTPPGSTRTLQCHVSYVPDTDGDGRTVGILMNVIDVTELSESEQRFRELVQSMTEGVALHELVYEAGRAVDYRILEANPAFEAQSGISAEAAEGRLASELYGTGEPPYLGEYASVAESGHSISFETYFAPMDRLPLSHRRHPPCSRPFRHHLRGRDRAQAGRGGAARERGALACAVRDHAGGLLPLRTGDGPRRPHHRRPVSRLQRGGGALCRQDLR